MYGEPLTTIWGDYRVGICINIVVNEMTPRIRLKDIAEKAGLSVAAVSMALKDHRSLPASTIKKVKALAKKWVMLRTLHFQHLQLTGVDSCERYLKEIEEEVTEPDDRIDYHA